MSYNQNHYLANRARIRAQQAEYRKRNREVLLAKKRAMWPKYDAIRRARYGIRPMAQYLLEVKVPPEVLRERQRVYRNVWQLIRSKTNRKHPLIGCSGPEFRAHLEAQFSPAMSWENYGDAWEVDHIKPLSSFDLRINSQLLACCHYSNTRPLTPEENRLRANEGKKILVGV